MHFPIKAVRTALSSAYPTEATLRCVQHNGADEAEPDPEQQERHSVLSLKYRIDGAPAPLKWEWHLTGVDSAMVTASKANQVHTHAMLSFFFCSFIVAY